VESRHKDRTEASAKQLGGKIKEGAGKLFGDEKLKTGGQADQAEGKNQKNLGKREGNAK